MNGNRLSIVELAPTVDETWAVDLETDHGVSSVDWNIGEISLKWKPMHDVKLRPVVLNVTSGGKATNVARVLGRLSALSDDERNGRVSIDQVKYLLAAPASDGLISPGARYASDCFEAECGMRPDMIPYEASSRFGRDRRCITVLNKKDGRELFNFSPATELCEDEAHQIEHRILNSAPLGVLAVAGSSPKGGEKIFPNVALQGIGHGLVTGLIVDTVGEVLFQLLEIAKGKVPIFVFLNDKEYEASSFQDSMIDDGLLYIHDKDGGFLRSFKGGLCAEFEFQHAKYLADRFGEATGSTIGAGDSCLAGFVLYRLFWGYGIEESLIFSQSVAYECVRNGIGIQGVDKHRVMVNAESLRRTKHVAE